MFISSHLHELADKVSMHLFMLILLPGLVLVTFIKSLKVLAATSVAGNLLLTYQPKQ